MPDIRILPDVSAVASAAAEHIVDMCSQAIRDRGVAFLALAGGGTPVAAYTLLSQPEYASRIEWSHLQIFWSDERLVPPHHADSNYRLTAEALLWRVPVPPENVHRMRGELAQAEAAQEYENAMRTVLAPDKNGFPCFDLMMVGMGDDGHIASLFPGSPALLERQRWVVATEHSQPPPPLVPRLTLTLPVINAAAAVLVIVTGEKKAERMRQVLDGKPAGEPLRQVLVFLTRFTARWLGGPMMEEGFIFSADKPVLVIGGAGVDIVGRLKSDLRPDTSNPAQIRYSFGGVARNVAENLARLGQPVRLMTALGQDDPADALLEVLVGAGVDVGAVLRSADGNTGIYLAVLDPAGRLQLALDDMRIISGLTPQYVRQHAGLFEDASMLFIDANLPKETLRTVMSLARQAHLPVCADPTSNAVGAAVHAPTSSQVLHDLAQQQ